MKLFIGAGMIILLLIASIIAGFVIAIKIGLFPFIVITGLILYYCIAFGLIASYYNDKEQ